MTANPKTTLNRRTVLASAGAASAVGAVGVIAAASSPHDTASAAAKSADARLEPNGGYQLTDHVKRYYATARV